MVTTTDHSLAAPTAMRLNAMVPQKILTNAYLRGRLEIPPNYCWFRLCRTSTSALFNNITYNNCLVAVLYVETSIFKNNYAPTRTLKVEISV